MQKGKSAGYKTARFAVVNSKGRLGSTSASEDDPAFNAAVKNAIHKEFESKGVSVGEGQADFPKLRGSTGG